MPADQMPGNRSPLPSGLGPQVVGRRVVVRRVLPGETGPTGGPAMTDVLGVCESWAGGVVTVRREDGTLVEIRTADIVSGKPVPPRPSVRHRVDPEEADRLVAPGWPAVETERLGAWLLRAAGGFSSRANSVLALGDPGLPAEDAVARVARWYADRGLTPRAHVLPDTEAAAAFVEAGWATYETTWLMLASVARVLRRLGPPAVDVDLRETVDDAWLATDERARRHGADALAVLEAGDVCFATVRDAQGAVLSRGRGVVHGDWVGVASLWTREDLRGTGLGSAVLQALLDRGASQGALTTYLQVVDANTAADRLYGGLGYERHHRYEYLVQESPADR